jgi:hypothetical protein
MSAGDQQKSCAEICGLLMFYVCGEVNEEEREAVERHVENCAECRQQLSEERELQNAIKSFAMETDKVEEAGVLLAQCRSELAETLDELERPAAKEKGPVTGWLRGWMLMHPIWSAATLVLLGLVAGTQYAQWANRPRNDPANNVVNVRPETRLTDEQLSKMSVAGINFSPSASSGAENVRVQLNAEQPIELEGNVDDSNVRSVLTYVVRNGQRFDSGMRLDCLEVLKARASDSVVRAALLAAARTDQNPAVRLKALEALPDARVDSMVRETLLEALQHDANPGVRVEAVNLLVRALEQAQRQPVAPSAIEIESGPIMQVGAGPGISDGSIEDVVRTLEALQNDDPSRYVRLRSAAALHQIGAHNDR